jgi:hypothetical protein
MKQRYPIAPVVPYTVDFSGTGSTPVAAFDGSGTIDLIMATYNGGVAGVVFGPNASMPVATTDNSLPVGTEWVRTTIGPATRFISVVSLDGNGGTLSFYLPGQTEI